MAKKTTTVLFLLVANLLLLVQVVIPHHHHRGAICIEFSHCKHNHHHDHSTGDQSHHHDCSKSGDCIVKNTTTLAPGKIKHVPLPEIRSENKIQTAAIPVEAFLVRFTDKPESIPLTPPNRYSDGTTPSCSGLRGPPTV